METESNTGSGGVTSTIIEEFDRFLLARNLKFQGIAIGATPLLLLKVILRRTKDCDVIEPELPREIKDASVEFAKQKRAQGYGLDENWLNNGPESIRSELPEGWRERVQIAFDGKALRISTLDRANLIRTKIAAYCDRGTDLEDCLALKPTKKELDEILPWVKQYDANPAWPDYVEQQVDTLKKLLGHSK